MTAAAISVSRSETDCGTSSGKVVTTTPVAVDTAGEAATQRAVRIWSAGDYDRIAQGFRHEGETFIARRGLVPDLNVLDAACGSGNLTIPAARTGATVVGFDVVPSLLAILEQRAKTEQLPVQLEEGTVETMPFANASFDVVLSMFGVMFAARPEHVVAELTRVTRPGGYVALANWTREGFIGQMLAMHAGMVPPPPGIPSPLLWADSATLHTWFDARDWSLTLTPRVLRFRFPHTPQGTAELFRGTYGPTVRTFEALDPDQRSIFAARLADHWIKHNVGSGNTTEVDAEYLEVVATRR